MASCRKTATDEVVNFCRGDAWFCTRSGKPHGGWVCALAASREFQIRTRILRKLIEACNAGH
jgi:hypothetical protein